MGLSCSCRLEPFVVHVCVIICMVNFVCKDHIYFFHCFLQSDIIIVNAGDYLAGLASSMRSCSSLFSNSFLFCTSLITLASFSLLALCCVCVSERDKGTMRGGYVWWWWVCVCERERDKGAMRGGYVW